MDTSGEGQGNVTGGGYTRGPQFLAVFYFLSWKVGKWCLLYCSLALAFGLSYISFKNLFPSFASTNSFYSCKNMFFSTDNREVKWNMRRLMEMFWELAVSIQESLCV